MTLKEIDKKLKRTIEPKRYIHSVNVMNSAISLSKIYKEDENKAAIAGLLHDCAKNFDNKDLLKIYKKINPETKDALEKYPKLLHGPVGAFIAKTDYYVTDKEILDAIKYHTTGKEDMGMLEKIIFISDYIEPGRDFPGVDDIREWAAKDIDKAMVLAFDGTIKRVLKRGALLHPSMIKARNFLIFDLFNKNHFLMYNKY